jgi:hypothetical protein
VCYVDPAAPDRSVLRRGWSNRYLTGGFGLVFILPPALALARLRRSAPVRAGTRAG